MNTLLRLYPGDIFALLVLNVLVQVTTIVVVAWALETLFARRNAATAHTVWLFALLCILLSPLTSVAVYHTGAPVFIIPLTSEFRTPPELQPLRRLHETEICG